MEKVTQEVLQEQKKEKKRLWTPEMEDKLIELNSLGNMSDKEIGKQLGGLTANQVYYKKEVLFSADGKVAKRDKFTPEEDKVLIKYCTIRYRENGSITWKEVAEYLPGRSARQCKDRWLNYFSPDVSYRPWTEEEDKIILEAVKKSGPTRGTFSMLGKKLKRSASSIRIHYFKKLTQVLHPDGVIASRRQSQIEILNNVNNDINNIPGNEQNQNNQAKITLPPKFLHFFNKSKYTINNCIITPQ